MVTCKDVMEFMQELAPSELAEEWDNIGLMAGSKTGKVEKILVCLDATVSALEKAADIGADLIVTHHPVIFRGLKSVTEDDITGKRIYTAIRNGISIVSAHTNLDHADNGVNAQLASVLRLRDITLLGRGPGRVGMLEERMEFSAFVSHVKECLGVSHVRAAGCYPTGIRKIAVFGGSFDDDLEAVRNSCVDVVVTGELKYHTALDASEAGMCIIAAGHFSTERIVLPYLASELAGKFPAVEVICFDEERDPFITY